MNAVCAKYTVALSAKTGAEWHLVQEVVGQFLLKCQCDSLYEYKVSHQTNELGCDFNVRLGSS